MQPYRCGCLPAPEQPDDLCVQHRWMRCHANDDLATPGECPNCWRARLSSVSLDSALHTLSKARRPGVPPHVRQADPGEFDDAPDLMQHTKVRRV